MRRPDMIGVNGGRASASRWQPLPDRLIVEFEAHNKWKRLHLRRRHGQAACLRLPGGDRLDYRLDLACKDLAGKGLERDLYRLTSLDEARIVLRDLGAKDGVGCIDEGHDGRLTVDAGPLAQGEIRT